MRRRQLPDKVRNIAPKVRIIKNVLVLGCASMCSSACFLPLRTFLSLTDDRETYSSLTFSLLYFFSALSNLLYGVIVARKLNQKITFLLAQVPLVLLLGDMIHCNPYTLLPTAVLIGLTRGPYLNAISSYLVNLAVRFSYLSCDTQHRTVLRFMSTFQTLLYCGWALGHLLIAGALNAEETVNNSTRLAWMKPSTEDACGRRYRMPSAIPAPIHLHRDVSVPTGHNQTASAGAGNGGIFTNVVPLYSLSIFFGCLTFGAVLAVSLLENITVRICSSCSVQQSARSLFVTCLHLLQDHRIIYLLPMFVYIGIGEAFVVCNVMQAPFTVAICHVIVIGYSWLPLYINEQLPNGDIGLPISLEVLPPSYYYLSPEAYVACIVPKSTVGYVMFSYGLTNMLLSAFLGSAMNHIGTVTLLLAGFAAQLSCLFVMWMWKPVSDDQPILYVIVTSWSVGNSIWQIVVKMMLYQSFKEQPEAPFVILYVGNAFGLSMGFLTKPFGAMEHKIYVVGLILVIAVVMTVMQEMNRQKVVIVANRT